MGDKGEASETDLFKLKHFEQQFFYHAEQRMKAFNFFVLFVGFIVVGYANAINDKSSAFGALIGGLGMVASVGFFSIDIRNAKLIHDSQDGFDSCWEDLLTTSLPSTQTDQTPPDTSGKPTGDGARRLSWSLLLTHAFVLRSMQATVFALSFCGMAYAAGIHRHTQLAILTIAVLVVGVGIAFWTACHEGIGATRRIHHIY